MVYTLYDYLITYQYKIIEAVKNGFPKDNVYNRWIYFDILPKLLYFEGNHDYDCFLKGGVYSLDRFYIGRTNKDVILRIIEHLMDVVPTPKQKEKDKNIDKVICTKYSLIISEPIVYDVLSDCPEDEELYIKESKNMTLVNVQYNNNIKSYSDYFKKKAIDVLINQDIVMGNKLDYLNELWVDRYGNDEIFSEIYEIFIEAERDLKAEGII